MFNFLRRQKNDPTVNYYAKEGNQPEVEEVMHLSLALEEAHLLLDRVALDDDGFVAKGSEKHYIFNRAVKRKGKENILAVVRIYAHRD